MQQFTPTGGDDTAALQAAISGATSLEILAGNGHISAPLVVDHPCEIVWRKEAVLWVADPACDVLSVEAQQVTLIEPRIQAAVPRTGGAHIRLKQNLAHAFKSEGGQLHGYHTGVSIDGVSGVLIDDLVAGAGVQGQGAVVKVSGGFALTIRNPTFNAPAGYVSSAGIHVTACGDLKISDGHVIGYDTNLLASASAEMICSLWVVGVFLDQGGRPCLLNATGAGRIVRSKFSNVWLSGGQQQGLLAIADGANKIDGLDLDGIHGLLNGASAIQIEAGVKNARVLGGEFAQNAGCGIAIGPNIKDFSVQGARTGNCAGLTGNGQWGIGIYGSGHSGYQVVGNDCRGNAAGSFLDDLSGTGKIVGANLC